MLFLLFVLACLRPSEAAFLQECEGYIINLVRNPNQECSEYIYCNGDNSYYCNGQCDEPVTCYEEASTVASTPSPTTTTEATTTITSEATTITTTTPSAGRADTETTSTEPPAESSTQSTAPPTQPHTAPVTPSTTSETPLSPQVRCRQSVRNEVYPYPANDTYYYQCISRYLLLQQCPQNFYFDESQGKCIIRRSYR